MTAESQYIDRRAATRSYRPAGHVRLGLELISPLIVHCGPILQMSTGLMRAREPYRVKNAVTGLAIGSFIVGVWLYSMSAVKQDNFDDVDEEARAMVRAGVKPMEEKGADAMTSATVAGRGNHRGLLALVDAKLPGLLDPEGKTVVFGAPAVDRIGRIGQGGSSRTYRA